AARTTTAIAQWRSATIWSYGASPFFAESTGGRVMDEIKGIARVKIHPGKPEEWKRLTEQAMEIVRARDPGTLQYEVFFNDDESEAIVFERYRDADAALEHFANIGHLMEPLMATATVTGEVLGTPNETMRAQLGDGEPKPLHPVDGRTRLDDTTPHPQRRERAPLDSDLQGNRQSSAAMRLAARNRPTDSACPRGAAGAAAGGVHHELDGTPDVRARRADRCHPLLSRRTQRSDVRPRVHQLLGHLL